MPFLRDTFQMLLWRGISIALGAVSAVLIARWLGPVDRGVFALAMLWVGLAALVLQFGVPEAGIYLMNSREYLPEQVMSTLLAYFCGVALLGALGCFAVCTVLGLATVSSVLLAGALALLVMIAGLRHFLLARREFGRYSLSVVIEAGLNLAALSALHAMHGLHVALALAAYLLSLVGTLVVLLIWLPRGDTAVARRHVRGAVLAEGARQGRHLFAIGLGGFGVQRIGYLLLERFSGVRTVGLFAAASALPVLFSNLPQQLATVLYTHVSASGAERGARLAATVFQLMAALGVLLLVPLYILRETIAVTLFGVEFAGIGDAIAVLSLSMLMTGLNGVLFNALAATGSAGVGGWLTALTLGLMIALGCVLIPPFGLLGAAWAQFGSAALSLVVVAVLFCRRLAVPARVLIVPARDEWRALWPARRPGDAA
jgi:O-antigen/teichoic acid export membrane protein